MPPESPLVLAQEAWPALAFQLAHARVAVQADDQRIAGVYAPAQAPNMAWMRDVEAAVGEYNALPLRFSRPNRRIASSK
jgi:hypothetical protein